LIPHQKGETAAVSLFEIRANGRHGVGRRTFQGQIDTQGRVGALIADVYPHDGPQHIDVHTLRLQFSAGVGLQPSRQYACFAQALVIQLPLDRRLAHGDLIGETHAVGR